MPATAYALREVGFQALPACKADAVPVTAGYGGQLSSSRAVLPSATRCPPWSRKPRDSGLRCRSRGTSPLSPFVSMFKR